MNSLKDFSPSLFLSSVIVIGVFILFVSIFNMAPLEQEEELLPASVGRILDPAPDHILVKFRSDATPAKQNQIKAKYDVREDFEISGIGVKIISLPAGRAPEALVNALNQNESDSIEFAEPDFVVEPSLIPDDPWFTNWQKNKQQINIPAAWDTTTGSSGIILAIVDTGVSCAHEDLAGQCVEGWNFYDNNADTSDISGHGTAVAGVAGALGNNTLGVAGNTWQSKIMPIRVSAPNGTSTYGTIAAAIIYAADSGAKVVNNSYQTGGSATVERAANYLKNKGGLLVISEGNYGSRTGYKNSPDIISVSAVDASDLKYSWSSFGADVDVSAPGCTGATTLLNGTYGSFCGTSASAPEVSGLLALIWSANPLLTPDQVQDILFASSKDLGSPGWDQYYGWGRIDADQAISMASGITPVTNPILERIKNQPRRK